MEMPSHIAYRFVPMGTSAPDPVPENEIWLDVGGRSGPGVFDHHGGDTEERSAAELVLRRFRDLQERIQTCTTNTLTVVLHQTPDLDAVCSAWLVVKAVHDPALARLFKHIEEIVIQVSENDQGLIRSESPETCWPIIMRLLLGSSRKQTDNNAILKTGMIALDMTIQSLASGLSLGDVSSLILTDAIRLQLKEAYHQYLTDLKRAIFFQVSLPVRDTDPSELEPFRITVDGIVLNDPSSSLFKELARGDKSRSALKKGFSLMVVARQIQTLADRPLTRYIISTDPLTGIHLEGLGKLLESEEQRMEDQSGLPLLPGRERIEEGMGRHGTNVASPWYDGRGHHFTIIDSPAIHIAGQSICASCLSHSRLMDTLMRYGSPGRYL